MVYTNTNSEEIKTLNIQLIASSIFIVTTFISIFITYNEKYNLKYGKRIIDSDIASNIVKVNRSIITILLIVFIYVNYKTREFDRLKGNNITPDNLEIIASYLSLIAGLIVLYIVFKYGEDAITISENSDI